MIDRLKLNSYETIINFFIHVKSDVQREDEANNNGIEEEDSEEDDDTPPRLDVS